MAIHDINVELPRVGLGNKDLKVFIHGDNEKIGELGLSKGTIEYYPAHKRYSLSLTWEQFDEMMSKRWEEDNS